ncbi:phage tail tape measure protein [Pseudomonas syringae pv. syringae]|uniref:phage tail tape measure protein n=1 Tax=Pseudomonas syringae TaxID=317 RepID=UPI000CDB2D43|nr:phage tail tape measure protein [Pseudomonas syringae]MCH5532359.1 phage tail tape measure protein [Pseudomonas syringae pv. syringae]MCH5542507.1 phage tail tape measure protein [Pseudomonas syringae pv. syringae]MCH5547461.1 phage tail tape measure protein [Pseudomonas syringae pv. syringae]MCH5603646.1 phage tail tape measure protein [Pseudomonas syringae pv. syringae]MCH5610809.1 phage tail tape measure protein [Pseudomonas syringae pv. syringae]
MADTIKTLITGVDKLSPTLATIRNNVEGFETRLKGSGLGNVEVGEMIRSNALAEPLIAGVKAAIGFETSMAGVKRSVTFETPQQFQQMSSDILDLSERLPESANGIAAIVAAGAKANVPREELTGFASDAVKMGVAFDQTAAESGDMMASWRSSFQMTQPQVAALSEKINVLGGNNLEKKIATMVTAMGPLGPVAGMASGQLAAMGATLASVDVPADVAASGMKRFMQSLTEGGAAKAGAFEALQLDVNQLTQGMQSDPSGTIEKVLTAVSSVDPGKQSDVITQLFGAESLGAITPLLAHLDVLRSNLAKVGEGVQNSGSIEKEFADNSQTTATAIKEMTNRVDRLGINIGSMFLPAMNEAMAVIGPMISQVAALAAEHPEVIKGVVGAAIAFGVLQVAVLAATSAAGLLAAVMGMSPLGLIVRGLALAAGFLIANWSTVAPYFQAVWEAIRGPVMALWDVLKAVFAWTPLGMIAANWQPLSEFFAALWDVIRALATPVFDFLQTLFAWSPLGMVVANWQPLSEYLAGLWETIKAEAQPFTDVLATLFSFSPLGMVIENWQPIKTWFAGLWADIKPFIEPIMSWFGGDTNKTVLQRATEKANQFAEEQRIRNAGPGGGTGAFLAAGAVENVRTNQQLLNQATGVPPTSQLLGVPTPLAPGSLLLQQGAAGAGPRLEGELNIRFENAPPGMRAGQVQTNQPGLTISPNVGYRTLGAGAGS